MLLGVRLVGLEPAGEGFLVVEVGVVFLLLSAVGEVEIIFFAYSLPQSVVAN